MPWFDFFWTEDVIAHLAEHGVTPEEFEEVVQNSSRDSISRSTGRSISMGYTSTGRWLVCIFELVDRITILPITAYSPEE